VNRKTRYAIFPVSPTPPDPVPPPSLSAGGRPHRRPNRISAPAPPTALTNTRPTPPRPSLSRIAAPLRSARLPPVRSSPSPRGRATADALRPPRHPRKSLPPPPPIAPPSPPLTSRPNRRHAAPVGLPTCGGNPDFRSDSGRRASADQSISRGVAVEMGVGFVRRLTTGPCDFAAVQGCCPGRPGGRSRWGCISARPRRTSSPPMERTAASASASRPCRGGGPPWRTR
jgi:hypothetical protein